jgi:type IV secretory pathway VirB10-like protein
MTAAAVIVGAAIGYAVLQHSAVASRDGSSEPETAKATVAADPVEPGPALTSAPIETTTPTEVAVPIADLPTPVAEPAAASASAPEPVPPPPAPRRAAAVAVKPIRETPRAEERAAPLSATVPEASLVFETRALVGTRKPKEQSAQLVLGDGKITIIPTSDPSTTLCAIPYGRVISINVSKSRDPLWNSPQGPAPVARAGGTLSKFGIAVNREWISLRTSTDEQFVAMRFDEVIIKRVLLALEERTGHQPEMVVLPTEEEKGKK